MDTQAIDGKPKGKWFTDSIAGAFVRGGVYLVGGLVFWSCITAFRLEFKQEQQGDGLRQEIIDAQNEAIRREAGLIVQLNGLKQQMMELEQQVEKLSVASVALPKEEPKIIEQPAKALPTIEQRMPTIQQPLDYLNKYHKTK